MTYLLTEVALEMMGYKLFGIDGEPLSLSLDPNKQDTMHQKPSEGEPTLDQILGLDIQELLSSTEAGPPPAVAANTSHCDTNSEADDMKYSFAIPLPPPVPAPSIIECMTQEYNNLREQIEQHKTEFIEAKSTDDAGEEQLMQIFLQQEKEKLQRTLEVVGSLRMEVEDVMAESDSGQFDSYSLLFD